MTFIPSYNQIDSPDPINPQDLATKHYIDLVGLRASCRYLCSGFTTSATANTTQIVPFATLVYDDAGAYNTGTGVFTCPYPGIYMVTAQFGLNPASGTVANRMVFKNGAMARNSAVNSSGYQETPIAFTDRCVAGDTLDVRVSVGVASFAIRTGAETALEIVRIGP